MLNLTEDQSVEIWGPCEGGETYLNRPTISYDNDKIRLAHGTQSVRDNQNGSVCQGKQIATTRLNEC